MRRQREGDQYVRSLRYESTFKEPVYATDDLKAKKTFSLYAFKELWSRSIKRSMFLQSETNTDGSVTIWPTKETRLDRTEDLVTVLYVGQRCVCHRRIAYSI
jgi:hypothetical protein